MFQTSFQQMKLTEWDWKVSKQILTLVKKELSYSRHIKITIDWLCATTFASSNNFL